MSLAASLNSPPLVAISGLATLTAGIPLLESAGLSLAALKAANLFAFCVNVAAVSVPGRIDGQQQERMTSSEGSKKPTPSESDALLEDSTYNEIYSPARGRTLVSPAGWAFAIWGPIYLGEAAFCAAQFLAKDVSFQSALSSVSPAFVVANLCQSLWCAAFRPSYNHGWAKYVSVAMLGSTALALSQVHAFVTPENAAYFVPITMHFGWTSAATLVNLNGSIAMDENNGDKTVITSGYASVMAATALGIGLTLARGAPIYGLTLAWALAACSSGMKEREVSDPVREKMKTQKRFCQFGSILCAGTAAATFFIK